MSETQRSAALEHDPIAEPVDQRGDHGQQRQVTSGILPADRERIGGVLELVVVSDQATNRHETWRCSSSWSASSRVHTCQRRTIGACVSLGSSASALFELPEQFRETALPPARRRRARARKPSPHAAAGDPNRLTAAASFVASSRAGAKVCVDSLGQSGRRYPGGTTGGTITQRPLRRCHDQSARSLLATPKIIGRRLDDARVTAGHIQVTALGRGQYHDLADILIGEAGDGQRPPAGGEVWLVRDACRQ